VVIVVQPTVGLVVVLAGLLGSYEFSRQRAAQRGRQNVALVGAVFAVVPTLLLWTWTGTGTTTTILAGYCAGAALQLIVAGGAGAGGTRHWDGARANLIWPMLYVAFILGNAFIDRLVLLEVGRGWAAAGAFAYNIADAIVLVIVGLLASEALAGRLSRRYGSRALVALVAATALAVALWPIALAVILHGGIATGGNLAKVRQLGYLYLAGVPGYVYWLFRSRVVQGTAATWRVVALLAGGATAIHFALSVPAGLAGAALLVPVGWLAAVYVASVLAARIQLPYEVDNP
jgi:hypothetical protein